jgi:hypothetical protein
VREKGALFFRHSGEGRSLERLAGIWIPAFAGMTIGLLVLVSCATNELQKKQTDDWPVWLKEKLKAQPVPVDKYTYKGSEYFLVDYKTLCCDMSSKLFGSDGVLICSPSGGFTGAGDLNCPSFVTELLDVKRGKN